MKGILVVLFLFGVASAVPIKTSRNVLKDISSQDIESLFSYFELDYLGSLDYEQLKQELIGNENITLLFGSLYIESIFESIQQYLTPEILIDFLHFSIQHPAEASIIINLLSAIDIDHTQQLLNDVFSGTFSTQEYSTLEVAVQSFRWAVNNPNEADHLFIFFIDYLQNDILATLMNKLLPLGSVLLKLTYLSILENFNIDEYTMKQMIIELVKLTSTGSFGTSLGISIITELYNYNFFYWGISVYQMVVSNPIKVEQLSDRFNVPLLQIVETLLNTVGNFLLNLLPKMIPTFWPNELLSPLLELSEYLGIVPWVA